tara:strand:- start:28 stop:426 length:399 start_codon:yes stop_codon:yes gene_type:complete
MSDYLKYKNGLGNAAAYQVSGIPFASGSIDVPSKASGDVAKIEFPYVTNWFSVCNYGSHHVRLGFSELGVTGSNFYCVHEDNHPTWNRFELKVTEIYLVSENSATTVDVIAGLTSIHTSSIISNWSGSIGVG